MAKDKPNIQYLHMGALHLYVGFTQNPVKFQLELERIGVKVPVVFLKSSASATTHIFEDDKKLTFIITAELTNEFKAGRIAGLLAHEATHVMQHFWENIGEHTPGHEANAYNVQWITSFCFDKWSDNFSRKCKEQQIL